MPVPDRSTMRQFIKKLDLPSGFNAPTRLTFGDIEATAVKAGRKVTPLRRLKSHPPR